jgi:Tetratricopeptide repeat
VVELADKTVSIIGRFATVSNALVAQQIELRGGTVRRGLSQRTALVALGRRSLAQLADGRLEFKLARAEQIGAPCLSENGLLRVLGILPPLAAGAGAVALDELPGRAGLDARAVRLLVLYDVVEPCGDECSFRDLIAAREVARLLGEGLTLVDVLRSAERLGRVGEGAGHPLARLKLVCDEGGRLARRIGERLAEMDGQLRLSLPYADNPSVDELFDAAEEAEQAGDLSGAAMLYRRCVSMDQRDPIAPFNLANVLREQGQHGEAKVFLELALAIDPEFADAWYNLALLKEAAGDKQGARLCLERAIAADPDYPDPVYNLAKLQFELGCFAEASRLWQRYLALDPDSEWSRRARSGLHLCEQHSRPGTG